MSLFYMTACYLGGQFGWEPSYSATRDAMINRLMDYLSTIKLISNYFESCVMKKKKG